MSIGFRRDGGSGLEVDPYLVTASRPVAALALGFMLAAPTAVAWFASAAPPSPPLLAAPASASADIPKVNGLTSVEAAKTEQAFAPPPFHYQGTALDRAKAVNCLALAAWYEAGSDKDGQRSVIQVVLNRMAHPAFPSSACGVVFEGATRPTGCQFTFTCDGSLDRRKPTAAALAAARVLAEQALNGAVFSAVRQATHYHANYVSPWWGSHLMQLATVGQHIFYGWPGQQGRLSRPIAAGHEIDISKLLLPGGPSPAAPGLVSVPEAASNFAPTLPEMAVGAAKSAGGPNFITVDRTKPNGSWAVNALSQCMGQEGCQLVAYDTAEAQARNSALPAENRDRPVFLFIRDKESGMEIAMWDCQRTGRADPQQCLPPPGPEYDRLMRYSAE